MNTAHPSIPFIPESAPFSREQRAWLNGFLAGSVSPSAQPSTPSSPSTSTALTILYGSQTGNGEALARKLAKMSGPAGFTPKVEELDSFDYGQLSKVEYLLVITSTYGDGEPPDNARTFFEKLMQSDAPRLESVSFSVFGLGDRNYPDFNECAKQIDRRLEELGAKRISETLLADVEFDADFKCWAESAFQSIREQSGSSATSTASPHAAEINAIPSKSDDAPSAYGKQNPFPAAVLANDNLNGEGSAKETRHITFSLKGSGLNYEAGDALAVNPSNHPRMVDQLIEAAGFEPDEKAPLPSGKEEAPLFEALRFHYDITNLTPAFLRACARLSKDDGLRAIVEDDQSIAGYIQGRQMIDPLVDFGVVFPTPEYLIAPLKQLRPRLYSISSSPKAHPDEVHITVGVVRYSTYQRERKGVCSNYLACLPVKATAPVYIHPNTSFRPPSDPTAPLIMVGPGTGIAPFRAFLEERREMGATGRNWLFFGDQKSASDFLYREELESMLKDGLLTRLDTAFSRDGKDKVYVQNRMDEHSEELFAWLEGGAHFCVCGDASKMARDVENMLLTIIAREKGGDTEVAKAYLNQMKKEKRYLRDVY